MTKEQMSQELSSFVAIINGHTETMNKIKEGLQLAMRADANPSLLDDVKEVLRHLTEDQMIDELLDAVEDKNPGQFRTALTALVLNSFEYDEDDDE